MSTRVITFGEIMGRLAPSGFYRFAQALPGSVDFTFGGGESKAELDEIIRQSLAAWND